MNRYMRNDKRKFHRFRNEKLQVEFELHPGKTFSSVEILDVSIGGLCFLTNTQVMIHNRLNFKFLFGSETITMSGSVARINGREVGVKFTSTEKEVIKFVNSYNVEAERLKNEFPGSKITRIISEKTYSPLKNDSMKSVLDIDL